VKENLFETFTEFNFLKKFYAFAIEISDGFLIKNIPDYIKQVTGYPKRYYLKKEIGLLFNIKSLLEKNKNSNKKLSLTQVFKESLKKGHFFATIKIAPGVDYNLINGAVSSNMSNLARFHCVIFPIKILNGYDLIVKLLPNRIGQIYRAETKNIVLILDKNGRLLDFDENFYEKFRRIYDLNQEKFLAMPVKKFIREMDWKKITKKMEGRRKRISELFNHPSMDWQLVNKEDGEFDFTKDWNYDPLGKFHKSKRKVHCSIDYLHSYLILKKPLPLNTNEFKIEFKTRKEEQNIIKCFIFGDNNPLFSPDAVGYLISIKNNSIYLNRATRGLGQVSIPFPIEI